MKCKCSNCFKIKPTLIYLPMYGYICNECYPDIINDYLK